MMKKVFCRVCLTFSILLMGGIVWLGFYAKQNGTFYIKTSGDPKETVRLFYDAVLTRDYDTAYTYLLEYGTLGFAETDSGLWGDLPVSCRELFQNALFNSYSYELAGEPVTDGLTARQQVIFTCFYLDPFCQDLDTRFDLMLQDNVQSRPRQEMFDDDGDYRVEVLEKLYEDALREALLERDKYLHTAEYTVELTYQDKAWKLLVSDEMLKGFLGQLHPGIVPVESAGKEQQYDLSGKFQIYAANQRSLVLNEYLSGENMIRKIYRIPDGTTKAPEPNPDCFGSLNYNDASQILDIAEQARASGLLEDQELVFDPDANFLKWGTIKYYLDETILVICWKEFFNGRIVNLMEVKIADASQFRRKLVGDAYGTGTKMFATQLAAETNGVAACSADFYAFRSPGMMCYEGTVYRYGENPYGDYMMGNSLDTLFIDKSGDFVFFDRGTEMTKEELQDYLDENQISFSLSFGPILVRDGVAQQIKSYPIGEAFRYYTRAGIGQVDHLHYLFVLVSHYDEDNPGATVNEFANILVQKGVQQGYNLDGGQTGEYIFNNRRESLVDFGDERVVSDIIYFATALPKEDWK